MASANDGYLRTDVDKGETSPDNDVRLRSYADKLPSAGDGPNERLINRLVNGLINDRIN